MGEPPPKTPTAPAALDRALASGDNGGGELKNSSSASASRLVLMSRRAEILEFINSANQATT